MPTKEELRAIYYAHYDRLPEPWKSECKENWDYEFAKMVYAPTLIENAVFFGFIWFKTGDYNKWDNFHTSLLRNEIPLSPLSDEAKFQSLVSKDQPPIINKLVEEQDFIDGVKKGFYEQFKDLYRIDEVWEYFEIFINPKKK